MTAPQTFQWMTKARLLLSIPFLVLGGFLFAWSLISFLGAPDGRIGTPDSLMFGGVFLLCAAICAVIFLFLNGRKKWAILTLAILYEAVPTLIALFMTVIIVFLSVSNHRLYLSKPSDVFFPLFFWFLSLAGGYVTYQLWKNIN